MGFKVSGFDKAMRGFQNMRDHAESKVREGVNEHTQDVFDETQARVPRKTNALAGTGRIEEKPTVGGKISSTIWYGEPGEGPGVIDYAAAVHEILDAKHDPPTGAKYVEQPLMESAPKAEEKIGGKMKELVKESFR
jgi:hypothetical protein